MPLKLVQLCNDVLATIVGEQVVSYNEALLDEGFGHWLSAMNFGRFERRRSISERAEDFWGSCLRSPLLLGDSRRNAADCAHLLVRCLVERVKPLAGCLALVVSKHAKFDRDSLATHSRLSRDSLATRF